MNAYSARVLRTPLTPYRFSLLCLIRAGLSPLFGAVGRQVGAVVRNLRWLHRVGFLRVYGRSATYVLSRAGRAITRS